MSTIPTQLENPKGLHQRYIIQKLVPHPSAGQVVPSGGVGQHEKRREDIMYPDFVVKEVDKNADYFVLRLDEGGSDIEHIKACRIGVNAYADAIEHHLPELAKDLRERYPLL